MTTTTVQNRTAAPQQARVVPKHRAKKAGLWVALVVGAIFSGFPVIWMLSSSFKARNVLVKIALVTRLRPLARLLGHRGGDWPY